MRSRTRSSSARKTRWWQPRRGADRLPSPPIAGPARGRRGSPSEELRSMPPPRRFSARLARESGRLGSEDHRIDNNGMGADSEVLIVGAGPVGLTLAIDLGQKGVRCTLIERNEAPQFLPKMERCNARTMEILRRMGLAEKIRAAGLDRNVPMDVYVILAMNEPPLLRLPYPSVAEAQGQIDACADGSMPLQPYQLISQYTLEPLLKSVAQSLPGVTVRYGWGYMSREQAATGVTGRFRTAAGSVPAVRAAYLVGCDGGASRVRNELGIGFPGGGPLLAPRPGLYCCGAPHD